MLLRCMGRLLEWLGWGLRMLGHRLLLEGWQSRRLNGNRREHRKRRGFIEDFLGSGIIWRALSRPRGHRIPWRRWRAEVVLHSVGRKSTLFLLPFLVLLRRTSLVVSLLLCLALALLFLLLLALSSCCCTLTSKFRLTLLLGFALALLFLAALSFHTLFTFPTLALALSLALFLLSDTLAALLFLALFLLLSSLADRLALETILLTLLALLFFQLGLLRL